MTGWLDAVQVQAERYVANVRAEAFLGADDATGFLQSEIARCAQILEGLADDGA